MTGGSIYFCPKKWIGKNKIDKKVVPYYLHLIIEEQTDSTKSSVYEVTVDLWSNIIAVVFTHCQSLCYMMRGRQLVIVNYA